jgi:hypothetical protein
VKAERGAFPHAHQYIACGLLPPPASDYNLFDKAKAVRCPVLVFRGMSKRFPLTAERFLRAFASEPKVVVRPRSGHFPTTTESGIVIEELTRSSTVSAK